MKKYKVIGSYDFSDYAEEITREDLIKINGGSTGGTEKGSTQTSSEYHGVPPQYWAALDEQKKK